MERYPFPHGPQLSASLRGWGDWIRTSECGSQSPVPCRLATPQYFPYGGRQNGRRRGYVVYSATLTVMASKAAAAVSVSIKEANTTAVSEPATRTK